MFASFHPKRVVDDREVAVLVVQSEHVPQKGSNVFVVKAKNSPPLQERVKILPDVDCLTAETLEEVPEKSGSRPRA